MTQVEMPQSLVTHCDLAKKRSLPLKPKSVSKLSSDVSDKTAPIAYRVEQQLSRSDKFFQQRLFTFLDTMQTGQLIIEHYGVERCFGGGRVGSDIQARIIVNDPSLYQSIAIHGLVGASECYMDGVWESPDLLQVIRFMAANIASTQKVDKQKSVVGDIALRVFAYLKRNTLKGSKNNISAHYDLGNDFFSLFLDPTMMYSSALFQSEKQSLKQASIHKLDTICQKLELSPEDHLLEIGTGWGGMAIHAAENYGCKVTTTTISQQQYRYACDKVKQRGLENKVTVLLQDYRLLEGKFDKLVSIEMIEAVGHEFYSHYFRCCSDLLKPNGLMLLQSITMADQNYEKAKVNVDFIKKHIFPGGCLPSVTVIAKHLTEDTDMQMLGVHDMGLDYGKTLRHWRKRFNECLPEVRQQGFDEHFIRMWEYYLCYCEGGFSERTISAAQLVFAKPNYRRDTVVNTSNNYFGSAVSASVLN